MVGGSSHLDGCVQLISCLTANHHLAIVLLQAVIYPRFLLGGSVCVCVCGGGGGELPLKCMLSCTIYCSPKLSP